MEVTWTSEGLRRDASQRQGEVAWTLLLRTRQCSMYVESIVNDDSKKEAAESGQAHIDLPRGKASEGEVGSRNVSST